MSARTAAGRSGGLDDNYGSKVPSTYENLNAPRSGDGLAWGGGGRGRGQRRKAGSRNDNIPHLTKEWVAMLEKLREQLPTEDGRRARGGARSSGTSGKPNESDDYRRMHRRTERTDQSGRGPKNQNSISYRSAYNLFSVDDWLRDDYDDDDDTDELNDVIDRLLLEREEKMRAEKRRRRAEDIVRRLEEVMQKKSDSVVLLTPQMFDRLAVKSMYDSFRERHSTSTDLFDSAHRPHERTKPPFPPSMMEAEADDPGKVLLVVQRVLSPDYSASPASQ